MAPDTHPSSGWQDRMYAGLALLLGLLLAGALLEGVARLRPLERVQVVDLAPLQAEVVDGVPVWRNSISTPERMGTPCTAQPEVVIVGSSIFWGSGVSDAESPRVQLAQRLPDACVTLLGQPGYNFSNQQVEVARHLEAHTPRVVVWEVWHNSPSRWTLVGDTAYNLGLYSAAREGLPSPIGLGSAANAALFGASAAYRHFVVSQLSVKAAPIAAVSTRFATEQMAPAIADLQARGVAVVLAYMPALDQPFEASASMRPSLYATIDAKLGASVSSVWIADELAARGVDVVKARYDTCCHYSASGSQHLADVLAKTVRPLLADPVRERSSAPPQP